MKGLLFIFLGVAATLSGQPTVGSGTAAFGLEHTSFLVTLLSPLSTKTCREGDTFTVRVEKPAQYQGASIEGKITKCDRPKRGIGKGKAQVAFEFDTLTFNSRTAPVTVDLKEVQNSKGVKAVDEEGQVIGNTSNKKRAFSTLAGGAAGAGIGAISGGASGAAKGGAIGAAAGFALGLTMTTAGSDLEFLPGSQFRLEVSDRGLQR